MGFSAGFITAQLEGKNFEDSVEFANATANLKITRVGARALPSRKAVERFLKETQRIKAVMACAYCFNFMRKIYEFRIMKKLEKRRWV
jgi:hypothetical protein